MRPLHWHSIQYFCDTERDRIRNCTDHCMRAQFWHFCRSYLKRFSDSASVHFLLHVQHRIQFSCCRFA